MKPDGDALISAGDGGLKVRYPSVASMKERHHPWPSSPETKKIWLLVWAEIIFLGLVFGAAWLGVQFLGVMAGSMMAAGISFALLRSTNIVFGPQLIKFPATFGLDLQGRLRRSWDDLESINLSPVRNGANETKIGAVLSLSFKSGGRADLELSRLQEVDLKLLMEAIEKFAPAEALDSNIKLVRAQHTIECSNTTAYSFIRNRNETLSPQYSLAAYVPKMKDEVLDGGEITIVSDLSCGGVSSSYVAASSGGNLFVREFWLGYLSDSQRETIIARLRSQADKFLAGVEPSAAQCSLMRFFSEDDRIYLCYEMTGFDNLREIVRTDGFQSEKSGALFMLQIARALKSFRQIHPGTIHGAITPSQIAAMERKSRIGDNAIILTELGFAQNLLSEESCTLLGDMSYLAPEQLTGKSFQNEESDIYAIAAVGQFLTTGEDPPIGSVLHPRCVIGGISCDFDNLIAQMSHPQPERRPPLEEIIGRLECIQLSGARPFRLAREAGG